MSDRHTTIRRKKVDIERDTKSPMDRIAAWLHVNGSWLLLVVVAFVIITLTFFSLLGCANGGRTVIVGPGINVDSEPGDGWTRYEYAPNVVPWNPYGNLDPEVIAQRVASEIAYTRDLLWIHPWLPPIPTDDWQHPFLTWSLKRGDCEDSALLLMSALRAEGYDAYIVVGSLFLMTTFVSGHAVTGVNIAGVEFLIDPTEANPRFQLPRVMNSSGNPMQFVIRGRVRYFDGKAYIKR